MKRKNKKFLKNSQRGVTLLLSLLVMAAILTIVLATSTIVFNEIKTSYDLTKSQPAITGAEAGVENAFYYIMRGYRGVRDCYQDPPADPVTLGNGVQLTSCASPYYPNPYTFNLPAGQNQRDIYLYNPRTPEQDTDIGYNGFTARLNSGASVTVFKCEYTSPCTLSNIIGTLPDQTTGARRLSFELDPRQRWHIMISNNSTDTAANVTVLATTDPGITNPLGIPTETTVIITTGSIGGVKRTIQSTLPQ